MPNKKAGRPVGSISSQNVTTFQARVTEFEKIKLKEYLKHIRKNHGINQKD